MPASTVSDFVIYHDEFFGALSEALEQFADVFNAGSNGCINLETIRHRGHYQKESFIQSIGSGLIAHRDITVTTSVADQALTEDEFIGVKTNRRIGPVATTRDAWKKKGQDPSRLSFALGKQIGPGVAVDYVNLACGVLAKAIPNMDTPTTDQLVHDGTAGTITHTVLNSAFAKMGDRAERIQCLVMHSKVYFDLIGQAIADKVFEVAGTTIIRGTVATFGRPVVVTDSTDLITTGAPDTYHTLCLTPGAIRLSESEDRDIVLAPVTGLENLVLRLQGEYAFTVTVKGAKWNVAAGGVNPLDATLKTGTNWVQVAADPKSCAGVLLNTQ